MSKRNREGQRVPDVSFRVRADEEWRTVTTADLFNGKNVVVFALPGAFTPTCSGSHVPRYNEMAPVFASLGIDDVLCVSVNDTFVMNAWQDAQGAEQIQFIPDGNGEFTDGMGMLVDKGDLGFGKRSWRYSMLVRDGVIAKMFIESEVPGDPFEVSDADTMLRHLSASTTPPPDVVLFTRANCGHCKRAKEALAGAGVAFDEVPATPRMLKALSDTATTPRVFVNGQLLGGADELVGWLEKNTQAATA